VLFDYLLKGYLDMTDGYRAWEKALEEAKKEGNLLSNEELEKAWSIEMAKLPKQSKEEVDKKWQDALNEMNPNDKK